MKARRKSPVIDYFEYTGDNWQEVLSWLSSLGVIPADYIHFGENQQGKTYPSISLKSRGNLFLVYENDIIVTKKNLKGDLVCSAMDKEMFEEFYERLPLHNAEPETQGVL